MADTVDLQQRLCLRVLRSGQLLDLSINVTGREPMRVIRLAECLKLLGVYERSQ